MLSSVKVKLQIWDTAGAEQFRSIASIYYKGAAAVCCCYDTTEEKTFDDLDYWVSELRDKAGDVQVAICGNKMDILEEQAVPVKTAVTYAKSCNASFHQTSAKEGTGINEMFQ